MNFREGASEMRNRTIPKATLCGSSQVDERTSGRCQTIFPRLRLPVISIRRCTCATPVSDPFSFH